MSSTPTPTPTLGQSHGRTVAGGAVGSAVAVLVVMFMPADLHVFTAEQASIATLAFGTIFSFLMRFLPQPKN
jgi:hypothetical protein